MSLADLERVVNATFGRDPQVMLLWCDGLDEAGFSEGEQVRKFVALGKHPYQSDDGRWSWRAHSSPANDSAQFLPFRKEDDGRWRDWYQFHSTPVAAILAAAREYARDEYADLRNKKGKVWRQSPG